MAISKKPSSSGASANSVDVDALIGRGGSPANATDKAVHQETQGIVPIVLRVLPTCSRKSTSRRKPGQSVHHATHGYWRPYTRSWRGRNNIN